MGVLRTMQRHIMHCQIGNLNGMPKMHPLQVYVVPEVVGRFLLPHKPIENSYNPLKARRPQATGYRFGF
jgi:hypothetical protein